MLLGLAIQQQPEDEPDEPQRPRNHERRAPTPVNRDPRHHKRSHDGADICPGIKDSRRQRPLFFRKPFGYGLNAGRKNSGFAESQCRTRDNKAGEGTGQGVAHRGQAPENHGERVTQSRAQSIDQPAHHHHANGIGCLEGKYQIAVVDFVPVEVVLKDSF